MKPAFFKFILVCIILAFMNGCAFIGAGNIGNIEYIFPKMDSESNPLSTMPLKDFSKMNLQGRSVEISDVENLWGKPDKLTIKDGKKDYTYHLGLRWNGLILIPVIPLPIPLALPVGHESITFTFFEDKLTRWSILRNHYCVSAAGFSVIPLDPEGKSLGLSAGSACQWGHKGIEPYNTSATITCDLPFYNRCYPDDPEGRAP
jgi:hypothetical protein